MAESGDETSQRSAPNRGWRPSYRRCRDWAARNDSQRRSLPFGVEAVHRDHLVLFVPPFISNPALPIVQVRDHAVVADRPHPPRDVEKLLAQPPEIHVDHHRRKRPTFLGVGYKRLHLPHSGRNGDNPVMHGWVLLSAASAAYAGGPSSAAPSKHNRTCPKR